jgi:type VI secretion system secreted protein VgrG
MANPNFSAGIEVGGKQQFELTAFSGREALSSIFEFKLELFVVGEETIDPAKLLGAKVKFWWGTTDGSPEFERVGYLRRLVAVGTQHTAQQPYVADIVPKLWFSTLNSRNRMFENMTATDIVAKVVKEYGLSLKGANASFKREFCLQYGETDFSFISRLLEEEGLCFHFENKSDALIISDGLNAGSATKCKTGMDVGSFYTWEHQYNYITGVTTLVDFDFEQPSSQLKSEVKTVVKLPDIQSHEQLEFPGGFTQKNRGDSLAKLRMEEEEADYSIARGAGEEPSFYAGGAFSCKGSGVGADGATNFLVTAISHNCRTENYASGGGADIYRNEFTCIPEKVKFRPPRRTPRPRIDGLQTGIVVVAEDKMDKYGRIRVKFNWAAANQSEGESESCWVRVAQTMAGKKWGTLFIPRVGQEVVISFLDGDPDRPLVIGAVYNGDALPPYELPGAWTQSGIKTQSQEGGANDFNELRFDDKKDAEEIYIQAQKDFRRLVKKGDDELIIEKGKRAKTLKEGDESTILEKGKRSVELKKGDDSLLLSEGNLSVEASKGNITNKLGSGKYQVDAKQGVELKGGSNEAKVTPSAIEMTVGGNSIKMDNSGIELKVGANSVKIEMAGITVKGVQVKIEGQASAEVKAPMTSVKGDGMLTIKGGMTMIN